MRVKIIGGKFVYALKAPLNLNILAKNQISASFDLLRLAYENRAFQNLTYLARPPAILHYGFLAHI